MAVGRVQSLTAVGQKRVRSLGFFHHGSLLSSLKPTSRNGEDGSVAPALTGSMISMHED